MRVPELFSHAPTGALLVFSTPYYISSSLNYLLFSSRILLFLENPLQPFSADAESSLALHVLVFKNSAPSTTQLRVDYWFCANGPCLHIFM